MDASTPSLKSHWNTNICIFSSIFKRDFKSTLVHSMIIAAYLHGLVQTKVSKCTTEPPPDYGDCIIHTHIIDSSTSLVQFISICPNMFHVKTCRRCQNIFAVLKTLIDGLECSVVIWYISNI
jgi:hypothetical protein